jgi:glutaredoxin
MLRTIVTIGFALVSATAMADGLYRWVDANGKVHYTDTAPTSPNVKSEKRTFAAPVAEARGLSYENQVAAKNFPVSLYTAPKCEPCDHARSLLSKRGVPFAEISVIDNKQRDELIKLSGGAELPVLRVGKQINKGYEAGMYNSALDIAGYGKSPAPGQATNPVAAVPPKAQPASDTKDQSDTPPRPKGRYAD